MRGVLFDTGTPRPLQAYLVGHAVDRSQQRGWAKLVNSKLLDEAERAGYDVLVTTDRKIPEEEDLTIRPFGVIAVRPDWVHVRQRIPAISHAVDTIGPGEYQEFFD